MDAIGAGEMGAATAASLPEPVTLDQIEQLGSSDASGSGEGGAPVPEGDPD